MINLEKIVNQIKEKQKTQKVFDSIDEPGYYSYLLAHSSNNEFLDKCGAGIKIFPKTNEYNAFAKVFLKENIFLQIIKLMKEKNKNPIIFDSFVDEDLKYIKFLKQQEREVKFNGNTFYIEYIPGGGCGMGASGEEIKVFILKTL